MIKTQEYTLSFQKIAFKILEKMIKKTLEIKSLLGTIGIAIAINMTVGSFHSINAKPKPIKSDRESVTRLNQGLPSYRRDGGTRSNCAINSRDFVAIIPDRPLNLTASNNPKLYFHVPESDGNQTIEFVLRDRQDRLVYETTIETNQAGIMSVEIPFSSSQQSLQSDSEYHWYLSNICHPQRRSQDIVLEGWIQRQTLSEEAKRKLAALTPVERASFYQQQNLWYDALAIAATEASIDSSDMSNTKWSEFLQNIGLAEFSDRPLVD